MYKIIFCGTPNIAVEVLKGLEALDVEIAGIISQPDKAQGRKKELIPTPVKKYAQQRGYLLFQPTKIKEVYDDLIALKADFLVTCAFGQFIPDNVLNIFKNSINIHASLLPQYRGGSPIQYAIKDGLTETGISLMKMIKKMDAGVVYAQETVKIAASDDAGSLFEKMGILGRTMVEKYLLKIFDGSLAGVEQDENKATFAYNLSNQEEVIDWNQDATTVVNFIRALSPKPIAFTYLFNERIKIKTARVVDSKELCFSTENKQIPGMIVKLDKEGIVVCTKSGYVKILQLQRAGKNMTSAGVFNFPNSPFKPLTILSEKPYKLS